MNFSKRPQHSPQESSSAVISTSSLQKHRNFEDDIEHKNLFPSAMYAHLCHSELETIDEDRNSTKLDGKFILQYYPQSHQFQTINSRTSPPIPTKTPFTLTSQLFPSQHYTGHHLSNLHEGN